MIGTLDLTSRFKKFKNKKYRHTYIKEHIRIGIAYQIRLLRNKLNITQSQLAEIIRTKQSVVSRLEDPDYGSVNLNTLFKIAEAFDIGLMVKFVSFGKFFHESQDVSPEALTVNNYTEDLENIKIQTDLPVIDIKMSPCSILERNEITHSLPEMSITDDQLSNSKLTQVAIDSTVKSCSEFEMKWILKNIDVPRPVFT